MRRRMDGLVRAFWVAFARGEPPEQRGMRLLKANLTSTQREQFERCRFFEVVGGKTGRRYRVHSSHIINVEELDASGYCIRRLCFSPCGHLPLGDVLLAQKTSLELFEDAALAVAGRWAAIAPRQWFRWGP
jgi:hypothetical protein